MRILFISSTRVGDAVLSTGLLNKILSDHPGARVTIACGPAAAGLFTEVPGLERLIVLDKMVFSFHWLNMWSQTIGHVWDIMIDLRNAPLSYLLVKKKSYRMVRARTGGHRIRQIAQIMGLSDTPPSPKMWVGDEHRAQALLSIPDGPPVLAIGPTANWVAKTWAPDRYLELALRLTADDGVLPGGRIAIFGRDDERPQALRLIEAIPDDRLIDLVGRVGLLDIAACFERSALYIGNDSGLMHIAAACGAPTLGLFGPSQFEHYAPWGENCAVVSTKIPYEKIFPANFDHRNTGTLMDSLSVDDAEYAAQKLWDKVGHMS